MRETNREAPLVEVRTAVPGAEITIGTFGVATNDRPALVPAEVAAQLEGDPALVVGSAATEDPAGGERGKKKARKGGEG